MKAIVFAREGMVDKTQVIRPKPGPGEVLIQVRSSGVSHVDLDILHARHSLARFPVIPGHEFSGIVVALGPGTVGVREGDRVVVDPNLPCEACRACHGGNFNLCENLTTYGIDRDGGLAEYCAVRATNVVPIGEMPFEIGALAQPMACVLNGIAATRPSGSDTALIFGAGPMGLLLALVLRERHLPSVTIVDASEYRLELAEKFGFRGVPVASETLGAMRRGADIVIDATGDRDTAARLVDYAADGGRVLLFGLYPEAARIDLPLTEITRRQLCVLGTHSFNRNFPEALAALRSFGGGLARLISDRLALDGIASLLRAPLPERSLKIQAAMP